MDKLYSWKARRAGGRITIEHSCGKIAGIDKIEADRIQRPGGDRAGIVATHHDGRRFELFVS